MTTTEINDFDAAKAISDQLKGMAKERQQRILRWVAESLDIAIVAAPATHDATTGNGPHSADKSWRWSNFRAVEVFS